MATQTLPTAETAHDAADGFAVHAGESGDLTLAGAFLQQRDDRGSFVWLQDVHPPSPPSMSKGLGYVLPAGLLPGSTSALQPFQVFRGGGI